MRVDLCTFCVCIRLQFVSPELKCARGTTGGSCPKAAPAPDYVVVLGKRELRNYKSHTDLLTNNTRYRYTRN